MSAGPRWSCLWLAGNKPASASQGAASQLTWPAQAALALGSPLCIPLALFLLFCRPWKWLSHTTTLQLGERAPNY